MKRGMLDWIMESILIVVCGLLGGLTGIIVVLAITKALGAL